MHELGGVLEQVLSSITKGDAEEWELLCFAIVLLRLAEVQGYRTCMSSSIFSCSLFKHLSAVRRAVRFSSLSCLCHGKAAMDFDELEELERKRGTSTPAA